MQTTKIPPIFFTFFSKDSHLKTYFGKETRSQREEHLNAKYFELYSELPFHSFIGPIIHFNVHTHADPWFPGWYINNEIYINNNLDEFNWLQNRLFNIYEILEGNIVNAIIMETVKNKHIYTVYRIPKDPKKLIKFSRRDKINFSDINLYNWQIIKEYENINDSLDDHFRLLNANIEHTLTDKKIEIPAVDAKTLHVIASVMRDMLLYNTTGFKFGDYNTWEPKKTKLKIPIKADIIPIDYKEMFIKYPDVTIQYFDRHPDIFLFQLPKLVTHIEILEPLSDAIISYLNKYDENSELLYYYLARIHLSKEILTEEEKLEILNYLLMAGDIQDAKSWRTQLFFSLISMPLSPGQLPPFDINLDAETMINLAFLNNKVISVTKEEVDRLNKLLLAEDSKSLRTDMFFKLIEIMPPYPFEINHDLNTLINLAYLR